jgi:hypothetical protein
MRQELRHGFLVILIVLVVQFTLGTAVNLFVTIPHEHPGSNPPEYFSGVVQSVTWAVLHGHVLLILHAVLGLVLVGAGFGIMARAIRSRDRATIWTATIGAVATLGAGFNGGSYLNYHEDFSSMIMAGFFAIAVIAYVIGLWRSQLPQEAPRSGERLPAQASGRSL